MNFIIILSVILSAIKYISIGGLVNASERSLQFSPHPEVTERFNNYELSENDVFIDAFRTEPVLVKFIKVKPFPPSPKLTFFCLVELLDSNNPITSAMICRKPSRESNEMCVSIESLSGVTDMHFSLVDFDIHRGFTVSVKPVSLDAARDGLYSCQLRNSRGSLKSIHIEIQDYHFYGQKLRLEADIFRETEQTNIEHINEITTKSLPVTLDCFKGPGNKEPLPFYVLDTNNHPFEWSFCFTGNSLKQCASRNRKYAGYNLEDIFVYQQFSNGTMVLLSFKRNVHLKVALMCTPVNNPHMVYRFYMTKSDNDWKPVVIEYVDKDIKLKILSPVADAMQIREGKYEVSRFQLAPAYMYDFENTFGEWTKNGNNLTNDFTVGTSRLVFPKMISKSMSGRYSFTFYQINEKKFQKIDAIYFDIKVVSTPIFKNVSSSSMKIVHMKEFPLALFSVFEGTDRKIDLEINGIPIDLSSALKTVENLQEMTKHNPGLSEMKLDLQQPSNKRFDVSISFLEHGRAVHYDSQSLTFVGRNEIGESRVNYILELYEKPRLIKSPSEYLCLELCDFNEPHLIECEIDSSSYERNGLSVEYYWQINEWDLNNASNINNYTDFVTIDRSKLTINKLQNLHDFQRTRDLFKDSIITCRFKVFQEKRTDGHEKIDNLLYDSDNYGFLRDRLKTEMKVSYAKYSFNPLIIISPTIFVSIVLVLAISTFVRHKLDEEHSEKYNVEDFEIQQKLPVDEDDGQCLKYQSIEAETSQVFDHNVG